MVTLLPVIRPGRRETKVDSAEIRLPAPGLPGELEALGVAVTVGFPEVPGEGQPDPEGVGHGEGVGVWPVPPRSLLKKSRIPSIGPGARVGDGLGATVGLSQGAA